MTTTDADLSTAMAEAAREFTATLRPAEGQRGPAPELSEDEWVHIYRAGSVDAKAHGGDAELCEWGTPRAVHDLAAVSHGAHLDRKANIAWDRKRRVAQAIERGDDWTAQHPEQAGPDGVAL